MTDYNNILSEFGASLEELALFLIDDIKKELQEQGHILTGALRDSMEVTQLLVQADIQQAFVSLLNYYDYVDSGVPRGRIPFRPGSGAKSSKYIEGLIRFWEIKKGLSGKQAVSAAFALAHKHKKEGMPTQSSWQFSDNGRRMAFMNYTLDGNTNYDGFEESIEDSLEQLSDVVLDKFKKSLR